MTRFDHIIVGAGSAGCVLANRLSADPARRVLLIEAGPRDSNPFIHMPAGMAQLVNNRRLNWNYSTEPQAHLDGRALWWPRGRVLGGSSSMNAMCYIRGQRAGTTTAGSPGARPAGAGTRYCRGSASPRTSSAARTPGTAAAAR